jgi:hypothetical protein
MRHPPGGGIPTRIAHSHDCQGGACQGECMPASNAPGMAAELLRLSEIERAAQRMVSHWRAEAALADDRTYATAVQSCANELATLWS